MFELYIILFLLIRMASTEFDALMVPFRKFKHNAFNALNESTFTRENLYLLHQENKLQPYIRNRKLPCRLNNTKSSERPTSVHQLRPGDIDIVAGIGDSLTAGVGLMATNAFQVALENRGYALSAGGRGSWRSFLTLPNILKTFNRKLTGYATATSLTLHQESQFNLGETGATSEDMPYMARLLLKRMKSHPSVNVGQDWKMITYMIGPNDFCSQICHKFNTTAILNQHRKALIEVLTILRDNLPRTIVNLIPAPNLRMLTEMNGKPNRCNINHLLECPCLIGPNATPDKHKTYFDLMKKWQEIEVKVGEMSEFDTDVFTVVVQPFTLYLELPILPNGDTDLSFFSPDCFHFSQKGNALGNN